MPTAVSRRRLLAGAGVLGAAAACGPAPAAAPDAGGSVATHGETQAGVDRPAAAQAHCDLSVWDMSTVDGVLGRLSERITALTAGSDRLAGQPPAGLTVTVGVGPRIVRAADPALPGGTDLPEFPGDRVDDRHRGGDLLLQVCGDDPVVVALAVTGLIGDRDLTLRWRQRAFHGPVRDDGAGRNLLGFVDGIVVPRGPAELARQVWLGDPRGATIAVVRRMRLDVAGFLALPVAEQERVFGRRRDTGEPLSGGGPDAAVDLGAKTADGQYLVPADAHVRRAHPLTSGSGLMLRRSYNFDDGPGDQGLLFVSFQRDLRTFVATQHRLAEGDALLRFAITTASATFLVLPGFTRDRPLGLG
ncbi:MAG TPA: Dyp-type peroxidase [Actinophytocola sp.]|uniref:Dyp-type peroxidase n=1 Tax=Actinophytocola sp. TaxID=1872138 RepID=UPI002DFA2E99|nr:Dyp-type peroxidase [Actinophytocola sp.]